MNVHRGIGINAMTTMTTCSTVSTNMRKPRCSACVQGSYTCLVWRSACPHIRTLAAPPFARRDGTHFRHYMMCAQLSFHRIPPAEFLLNCRTADHIMIISFRKPHHILFLECIRAVFAHCVSANMWIVIKWTGRSFRWRCWNWGWVGGGGVLCAVDLLAGRLGRYVLQNGAAFNTLTL